MSIKETRDEIDRIDQEILNLLSRRFSLLSEIIKYKLENNLPIQDLKREQEIIQNKIQEAAKVGIDADFVENIFKNIMAESRRIQGEQLKVLKNDSQK